MIRLTILNKFETRKKATAAINIPTVREAAGSVVAANANALVITEPTAVEIKQESSAAH